MYKVCFYSANSFVRTNSGALEPVLRELKSLVILGDTNIIGPIFASLKDAFTALEVHEQTPRNNAMNYHIRLATPDFEQNPGKIIFDSPNKLCDLKQYDA